jgi:hypothetical protein
LAFSIGRDCIFAIELGLDNEQTGRFNQLSVRAKRCGVSEEMLVDVLDLFVKEVEQSFEGGQAAGRIAGLAASQHLNKP